jgi:serine/threonine protein phosphatase PrpC
MMRCLKCGAQINAIDERRDCHLCGYGNMLPELERLEVVINSNLAGVSDRGLRHHCNQDYLDLSHIDHLNTQILVVCDGVSSSEQPELAARTAAESACQFLTQISSETNPEVAIKSAFDIALSSICDIPIQVSEDVDPPSTTIVAALVKNGMATIGWLGDSRAYWIDYSHRCKQLTRDDSWFMEVVTAGKMTEIEAQKSPHAHVITRWLSADNILDTVPSIVNFKIPGAGYLLLCTDGLWNYTPEPQHLANLLHQISGKDAITISRALVEFARSCGGHDNITVGILTFPPLK